MPAVWKQFLTRLSSGEGGKNKALNPFSCSLQPSSCCHISVPKSSHSAIPGAVRVIRPPPAEIHPPGTARPPSCCFVFNGVIDE